MTLPPPWGGNVVLPNRHLRAGALPTARVQISTVGAAGSCRSESDCSRMIDGRVTLPISLSGLPLYRLGAPMRAHSL